MTKNVVLTELEICANAEDIEISDTSPLIGDNSVLDSMGLVELCLRLEDRASEMGFVFDWTSEDAMSRGRSIFRSVGALQAEFDRQREQLQ
jgi:acyl carrier protein